MRCQVTLSDDHLDFHDVPDRHDVLRDGPHGLYHDNLQGRSRDLPLSRNSPTASRLSEAALPV